MLIGLFGILTGYDGGFAFAKPGDEYGETRYVGMRVVSFKNSIFIPTQIPLLKKTVDHFCKVQVCLILYEVFHFVIFLV